MRGGLLMSGRMKLLVAVLLGTALPAGASAQTRDIIGEAEEAYLNVDFDATLALAEEALESGRLTPDRVVRVYELIGVAAAASGDEDRARDAYKKMLALQPDSTVDTNLAPRLRAPFMEARGFWSTRSDTFAAEVRLVRQQSGLRVLLTDPISMATEIRVLTRVEGEMTPMHETRVPPSASALIEVPGLPDADRIEYVVQVLDANGNRLFDLGTEDEPNVVGRDPRPIVVGGGDRRIPVWVWAVVGGVIAAAAVGVGLYFGLRHEPITLQSGIRFE